MKFNLFKRNDKDVINNSGKNEQANDIVDDFSSYLNTQGNQGKAIIEPQKNNTEISSFDYNFTESIGFENNNYSYDNDYNQSKNLNNNFEQSYTEETNGNKVNTDILNKEMNEPLNFHTIPKEKDNLLETETEINQQEIFNPVMSELNEIPNNINNSEDVNVALANIHKKEKNIVENEQIIENMAKSEEINTVSQKKETPVFINTYQNSDVDPGYKRCPKCGQKIREDYKQCFVCGTII